VLDPAIRQALQQKLFEKGSRKGDATREAASTWPSCARPVRRRTTIRSLADHVRDSFHWSKNAASESLAILALVNDGTLAQARAATLSGPGSILLLSVTRR
jgi:hypothetical protein